MNKFLWIALCILLPALSACTIETADREQATPTLTVLTHDSYDVDASLISQFEQDHQVKVEFLKGGDAGQLVNTAILQKNNPVADVLFGVDSTFLGRAVESDLFVPYTSDSRVAVIEGVREYYPGDEVTPIDYGDVCVNYDINWFAERQLPIPDELTALTLEDMHSLLVVENPATSSPGLSFLLLTIGQMGEQEAFAYWAELRAQGVQVADGWDQAYWGDFSGGGSGERPLVVSYATSPAAAVYFSEEPLSSAPTAAVTSSRNCFRQIEYAGILQGTEQEELAQKFIDFMLSEPYQEDLSLKMWVYPVRGDVALPEVFQYSPAARDPILLGYDIINENRDRWIEQWTSVVLE